MRRCLYIIVPAAIMLFSGCQSSESKKPVDPRSDATKQWNAARSAVELGLAQDQYATGNFDKCRESIDQALKLTPENPAAHVLSAKLFIEKGLLEEAERELKFARGAAPNDPESNYLSGIVYQRWQKPELALQFYKFAAEKAPAEQSYLLAQAETLIALDRNDEALTLLAGKVQYFENSGVIRDEVGQLLIQAGRFEEAVAMLRQASLLTADDLSIRERLGLALYYQKQYRESAEVLVALVQKDPYSKRADLFTMLGECELQLGKPRDARYSLETASNLQDNSAPIWRDLGQAALQCGDLKRAEMALVRSLTLDGGSPETYLLLGYLHVRQDRLPEALTRFERASALDKRDTVSVCMEGYVFEKLGRHADAMQCYATALRLKPDDDMATKLMAAVDLHDQ